MSEYGLLIAEDGKSINQGRNKIDSRRRTLILDLEANPPHMQIVEVSGGSAYTDDGSFSGRKQDVLFRMDHHLDFTPLVDAFFYVSTISGVADGGYGSDVLYLSGAAGTFSDVVTFEADSKEFRIVHDFDVYGFITGFTSLAPNYRLRVKFYIYSIDIGKPINYGYPYDGNGHIIQQ